MHCAAAQPTKPTAKANALEKNVLKRSIHRALVKFFTCLPHTPPHSPIAPTAGQRTVAWCSTIEYFEAASNYDSNFDPWVVCIHGREWIIVTKGIPHFYPSQCSPIEAIYHPRNEDWSLSSAMENIKHDAQQMEQALAIISNGVTSSQARG